MKNIFTLLLIFSTVLLINCGGDSDDNSDNSIDNSLLLRKWYMVSQTYQGQTNYHKACGNGNRDYIEFLSPNVLNAYYWHSSSDCSYVLERHNWSKKDNDIKITTNNTLIETYSISELTVTTLSFVVTGASNGESAFYVYSSF